MNKALLKDTFREIKISAGRFFSILAIVALGCAFFAGLKATMPDMVDTAKEYFEDNKLMDYKLVSSFGVHSQDIEAIKKIDSVQGASAAYSKELFYNYEQQNYVLKAISYSEADRDNPNVMNYPVLTQGRMPSEPGECLIEKKVNAPHSFEIGNMLEFTDIDDTKQLTDTLEHKKYKIVGICSSPMYIGYKRDNTKAGNGSILCNIYLPESEFKSGYYTEGFVRFKDIHQLDQFSWEYRKKVNELKDEVTQVFKKSVNERYDKEVSRAKRDIDFAKKQSDNLKTILSLDKAGLQAYDKKLAAQQAQIEKDESLFSDAELENIQSQRQMVQVLAEELSGKANGMKKQMSDQIAELTQSIKKAEQQLSQLKQPEFYGFDRFQASLDYNSFCGDANKIDSISKVFPVFFILVASLVCLTTMTRMVDEHRIRIGTYKALGYSPAKTAAKYLIYGAAAAVIGSCIGTAAGLQIFPRIIYSCYKIMYNIPSINTPFKPKYLAACCGVSVICICGAVLYSCIKALRSQPSQLMRPKAPQSGRRVVLERVGFIWNNLSFLSKVTVRNLLRYKKRFFMTLVGVAGCTALIITGFGLKHSISDIVDKQFGEILLYDAALVLNTKSYDEGQLKDRISSLSQVENFSLTMINDGKREVFHLGKL